MNAPDGSIALSFTALQSAEAEIGRNLAALRARLERLETELNPLVQSWSGDAQAAYLIQKQQWETAAADLATMLGAIVAGLGNTSVDYATAQQRIVATFS